MEHIVKHEYQLKRGKEEAILRQDPILKYGEPITMYREDGTTEFKVGDGIRPYSQLPVPNKQVVMQADLSQNDETQPDYVKNRTHYVRKTYDEITWDGVVEEGQSYVVIDGDDNSYMSFVKVSDITPTVDEMLGAKVELCEHIPGEDDLLTEFIVDEVSLLTDMIEDTGALIIFSEDTGIELWVIYDSDKFLSYLREQFPGIINNLSNGIYVLTFVDTRDNYQIYVSEIEFKETVKKIDEKFLPEIAKNYTDLIDAPELKNGTNPHSLLAGTGTTTSNDNQLSIGMFNRDESNALFVVGNGTSDDEWVSVSDYTGEGQYRITGIRRQYNGGNSGGTSEWVVGRIENYFDDLGLAGLSLYEYASPRLGYCDEYIYEKRKYNRSNAFTVYRNGTIAIDNKIFDPQGFLEEVKNTFIQTTNNNITNSVGKSSLQQAADDSYSYVAINSKNPLVSELGLGLTDETPIGAKGDWAASFGGVSAAIGKRAFSCGTNTVAYGKYSFACGDNSVAFGNDSFVGGLNCVAKGSQSFAVGQKCGATGQQSFAIGGFCMAHGPQSFAGGQNSETVSSALRSFAFGDHCKAYFNDQFVVGKFNQNGSSYDLFVIGAGTSDKDRRTAFRVNVHQDTDHDGGAYVFDEKLITENKVDKKLSDIRDDMRHNYNKNRRTVSGEILELKDISSVQSFELTSTVTDNYFYKENLLINSDSGIFRVDNNLTTAVVFNDELNTSVDVIQSNLGEMTHHTTGFVIIETPSTLPITNTLCLGTDDPSTAPLYITVSKLKPSHQYMIILKLGTDVQDNQGAPGDVFDVVATYVVDYEDSVHWVLGNKPKDIPVPNCIMIPHKGRIDKNDTLTASYEVCEIGNSYHGFENGEHYVKIGETKVTETQLKNLLNLLTK